jgi:NADH-quinone oxidoreductase subunit D
VSVPANETYIGTEAPKGEFGVYLISDNTNNKSKFKFRQKKLFNSQFRF